MRSGRAKRTTHSAIESEMQRGDQDPVHSDGAGGEIAVVAAHGVNVANVELNRRVVLGHNQTVGDDAADNGGQRVINV